MHALCSLNVVICNICFAPPRSASNLYCSYIICVYSLSSVSFLYFAGIRYTISLIFFVIYSCFVKIVLYFFRTRFCSCLADFLVITWWVFFSLCQRCSPFSQVSFILLQIIFILAYECSYILYSMYLNILLGDFYFMFCRNIYEPICL